MPSEEHKEIVHLLKQSIAASNRVNHAVRAIVLPSTIVLITILVVIPVLALFFSSGNGGLLTFAGLVLIGGGIYAVIAQIQETRGSNPYSSPETGFTSGEKCRFCRKPIPPGTHNFCPHCGNS